MDEIYNWVKNIVIYMIFNTIIMNLLGNSSYKKYVSVVSGMILVLIVISPLLNVMELDKNLDYFLMSNDFSIEKSNFKNDLRSMEIKQSDAVITEYQDRLNEQVGGLLLEEGVYLSNFDFTLDMNVGSRTFGEILVMNIKASVHTKEEETVSMFRAIDAIEISKIGIGEKREKEQKNLPSPIEINIKNKLSDFYNIEPDNINISIQGG